MDFLFRIAVFLIPFDNLFFAPSRGWATIAPIFFFLYVILNLKYIKYSIFRVRKILLFIYIIVIISLVNYFFYPPNFAELVDSFVAIFLGITFLFSLDIYFNCKKKDSKIIFRILFIAYSISLLIGFIQFVAYKFEISFLIEIFRLLSKRYYSRVQFTFTEPSFISMHLFGVLLPILFFFKKITLKEYKKLRILLFIFVIFAGLVASSVRFLVDILVIVAIYLVSNFKFKSLKDIFIIILSGIILSSLSIYLYNNNYRFQRIVDKGLYSDASLASRYFRINASIKGYKKKPLSLLSGYGISNAWYPLNNGYDEAVEEYNNSYMREVEELYKSKTATVFSMHIRIISEMGLIMWILILILLYDKQNKFIYFILLYLYIQFDSYAFYTLWIYIFFSKIYQHSKGTLLKVNGKPKLLLKQSI